MMKIYEARRAPPLQLRAAVLRGVPQDRARTRDTRYDVQSCAR